MVSAAGHRRALGLPLPYHKLQGGPPGYSCVREAPSVIHRALSPKATRWGSVGGSGPAFQKAPPACFTLWSTGHPPTPTHTHLFLPLGLCFFQLSAWDASSSILGSVFRDEIFPCGGEGTGQCSLMQRKTPSHQGLQDLFPGGESFGSCDLDTHRDLCPALGLILMITRSPRGSSAVPLRPEVCSQGVSRRITSEAVRGALSQLQAVVGHLRDPSAHRCNTPSLLHACTAFSLMCPSPCRL